MQLLCHLSRQKRCFAGVTSLLALWLVGMAAVWAATPAPGPATPQDKLLAEVHQTMVDDALMLWVVHDTNPHVLSPKVQEFVQAQHWFQDITTLRMK